jgi:hypothetical protein
MPVGKLYLIPNVIAENTQDAVITAQVKSVLPELLTSWQKTSELRGDF